MTRKSFHLVIGSLAAAMTLLGAVGSPALARTVPASSGLTSVGALAGNFNASTQGVAPIVSSGAGAWLIPVPIDNSGSKTIQVLGRVSSGQQAGCLAFSLNSAGALVGTSPLVQFTPNGTFHNITLSLSSAQVPPGAQVSVACTFAGTSGTIVGLNYNQ